jgi:hypothetical protein
MNEKNPKWAFVLKKGNYSWVIMMIEKKKPNLLKRASPTQSSIFKNESCLIEDFDTTLESFVRRV